MPKTKFTKSELVRLHQILKSQKMIPCDKICVFYDVFNSGYNSDYTILRFVKNKHQLDIGLVTKTVPKIQNLEKQLNIYFTKEYYDTSEQKD